MADQLPGGLVAAPIDWHILDSIETKYATNVVVQHTENEFVLYFFELWPPLFRGTAEERQAQLRTVENVRANCVARVVIAAPQMPSVIETLQENLNIYIQRMGLEEQE